MKAIKFFSFFGGKTHLLEDIYKVVSLVRDKITCFVDVFGGSGVVILNLPWKFNNIVYNDIDYYLYKTFKVIQNEELRKKLLEKLELAFRHRAIFEEFKEDYRNDNKDFDDVEIAFRTIYLFQNGFNGNPFSSGFRTLIKFEKNPLTPSINTIKNFSHLIRGWIIENLDFRELIKKYDSPTTFFYLDPPYLTGGKNYKFSWTLEDFKALKNILDNVKGFWLLNESERDFDEIIKIFGEPKFVKEYSNAVLNRSAIEKLGGKRSKRKEGFWFNFEFNNEKELKLSNFLVKKENNHQEIL